MLSANLRLGYVCVQLDKSDIERSLSRNQPIFYNGSSSALSRSEHLTVTPLQVLPGGGGRDGRLRHHVTEFVFAS